MNGEKFSFRKTFGAAFYDADRAAGAVCNGARGRRSSWTGGNESGTEPKLFLPDEFYNKNLPNQVAPETKYLPKYDELGNVKQIKMYDDYGREIGWVDYTNHGFGDINSLSYHSTLA